MKSVLRLFFGNLLKDIWLSRYESYGWVKKSLILVLLTVVTASAIVCELIAFSLFKENVIIALLVCILFIALGTLAFRMSLFFSGVALRMASTGTVQQGLLSKKVKKEDANVESEDSNNENEVTVENGKIRYKTRGLDIAIGIIGFVYAIGVIITMVALLIDRIGQLKK